MQVINSYNRNQNFKAKVPRNGSVVAQTIKFADDYNGIKGSIQNVCRNAKENCLDFLCVPFYPLVFGVDGKKEKDDLHAKSALGIGTLLGIVSNCDNIKDIYNLNPRLKNTNASQKREFVKDFTAKMEIPNSNVLKNTTISKLLIGKQKALLKDTMVRLPLIAAIGTGLCLASEALYNKFMGSKKL